MKSLYSIRLILILLATGPVILCSHRGTAQSKDIRPVSAQVTPDNLSPWLTDVPLKIRRKGILPEETETYYQILGYARDVDTNQINKAAHSFLLNRWKESKFQKRPFEKFPVYVDIYLHPELYKGYPVTMSGHIQRTVKSNATANDFGIDSICEAWLYTEDSQANPTVVISTDFPEGFPIGEQVIDHVTVTGYFYRMYTYDARDTRRFAPLLIAHEIKWEPISEANQKSNQLRGILTLIFGVIISGVLLGSLFLVIHRNRERSRKNVSQILTELPQPEFEMPEGD